MNNLLFWFALKSINGIGNILFKRLIDRFKTPEQIFNSSIQDLTQVEGISQRIALAIKDFQINKIQDNINQELERVYQKNYKIITLNSPEYPFFLKEIPDPPPILYVYGNLDNSFKNIAVVGSRTPTNYGTWAARQICKDLALSGIRIVSGLASGIDTVAHLGALDNKGKTIAVLGSGLEKIYPIENQKLFHKIAENGAVITEFELDTTPNHYNFPARNRIISGLCLGTVVVEAAQRSGALITARLSLEQGREVFAVPGNINSIKSFGTNKLIQEGAKLIQNAQDILDEFSFYKTNKTGNLSNLDNLDIFAQDESLVNKNLRILKNKDLDISELFDKTPEKLSSEKLSEDEQFVLKNLPQKITNQAIHIDELARKIAFDTSKLSSILLELELKDLILKKPGNLFALNY